MTQFSNEEIKFSAVLAAASKFDGTAAGRLMMALIYLSDDRGVSNNNWGATATRTQLSHLVGVKPSAITTATNKLNAMGLLISGRSEDGRTRYWFDAEKLLTPDERILYYLSPMRPLRRLLAEAVDRAWEVQGTLMKAQVVKEAGQEQAKLEGIADQLEHVLKGGTIQ